jgi:hypothetical protein
MEKIYLLEKISLLPDDILYNIFTFDRRFVLRNNKWYLINKITKDDFRYSILQKKIIITKSYRTYRNNNNTIYNNQIVLKKHKNISSIIIYDNDNKYSSDIEFSHYLYKTIHYYKPVIIQMP